MGWINKKLEINSAKRQKFFSPVALRVALQLNQHSSHRIPRFFPMVRQSRYKTDHPPSWNVLVKNVWSCNSTSYTFHNIIFNDIQGQFHFNILHIMLHAQVACKGHIYSSRFNISVSHGNICEEYHFLGCNAM